MKRFGGIYFQFRMHAVAPCVHVAMATDMGKSENPVPKELTHNFMGGGGGGWASNT